MDMLRKKDTRFKFQFAGQPIPMLESPAWRVMSMSARRVVDRIQIEFAHHGGKDNGKLPCTYNHFVEYGIDRHSVGPAIRESCALGFLEVTERGRPSAGEFRSPNKFRLTFRHTEAGGPATDEWQRIKSTADAKAIARAARANKQPFLMRGIRPR